MNALRNFCALLLGVACLAFAGEAAAACEVAPDAVAPPEPPANASALGATTSDGFGRMVASVRVNGQGPFRFIVDTGANRSVLSQALADQLGLVPNGVGDVHSVLGISRAPLVGVESLHFGDVDVRGAQLPLLQGAVLAGEQGLLGVDGLEGSRLRLDFERRCIEIRPSRGAPHLAGWFAIRGQMKFGHLLVVPGRVRGVQVNLLLDTGADGSLANLALRNALNAHERIDPARIDYAQAYNAGHPIVLDRLIVLPRLTMGTLEVRDVAAYVGDFHIFTLWDMIEQPTLLLGMDVLSQARGMAIDYQRGMLYLHVRDAPAIFPSRTRRD